ncbi:YveK family protein [Streptomyces harbinensis]|uniref:lipopolysaccharide biosynthesis protein n=1 Tax=Streptomyces harbinensis TaxID=1176198 RepID=UPI001587C9F1|nr:lipopolysaccharide biosynthesis protein [Streptomyces harbinensis]
MPVWWPLLLCALAGTLGGAGYGLVADREYAASGYVVVRQAEGSDPAGAVGNAQAFGRIATGDAVLTTAQADAGVTLAELRDGVRAATSPDAPMIEITGTATSGARAAEMANAVARALIAYGNDAAESTGARLTVFADAQPSAAPVSSTPLVRLAVGLVAGLVVGLLVLLVRTEGRDPAPAATAVPDQTARTDRTDRPDGTDRADRTDRALRSLSPR